MVSLPHSIMLQGSIEYKWIKPSWNFNSKLWIFKIFFFLNLKNLPSTHNIMFPIFATWWCKPLKSRKFTVWFDRIHCLKYKSQIYQWNKDLKEQKSMVFQKTIKKPTQPFSIYLTQRNYLIWTNLFVKSLKNHFFKSLNLCNLIF